MNKNTLKCVALGGWFLGAVLFMNCCYSFVSDDAMYGIVRHCPDLVYGSRIGTISRAWYENVAGCYRPVVHLFVRVFTGCFDKWVFNVCNTLMMGCFMLLLMRYSRKRWALDFQSLVLCVTLYVFCMCKGDSYLWCAGSLNYLWSGAGTLAFLIFRDRIEEKPISTSCLLLASPFIVLSGWLQESFSLPVCFALGIVILTHIKELSRQKFVVYSAYLFGSVLLIWSAKDRVSEIPPFSISAVFLNFLKILAGMKAVWVLVLVMIFERDKKSFFLRNAFEFLVVLGSVGLIMVAGFAGERCLFVANMVAIAVIVREIQLPKWAEIVFCCAMAMLFCGLVPLGVRQKKSFDEFLRLYRQSSDNVTCHERVSCGLLSRYFHQAVVQWSNGVHSWSYANYFGSRHGPPIALSRELYDNLYLQDRFCCSSNRLNCPGEFYSRPEENTIVMPLRMNFEIPSDTSWRIDVVYDDSANSWIRRVRRCFQTEIQPVRDGGRGCVLKTSHGSYLLIAKEPFSDKYIRGVSLPVMMVE